MVCLTSLSRCSMWRRVGYFTCVLSMRAHSNFLLEFNWSHRVSYWIFKKRFSREFSQSSTRSTAVDRAVSTFNNTITRYERYACVQIQHRRIVFDFQVVPCRSLLDASKHYYKDETNDYSFLEFLVIALSSLLSLSHLFPSFGIVQIFPFLPCFYYSCV